MRPIVYLTLDGLLEPLGRSQVMQPLIALAERGFDYTVISLERERDLADTGRVEATAQALRRAGVRWRYRAYASGGTPRAVATNVGWLAGALRREVKAGAGVVHARSYVTGTVARAVAPRLPWLFDARGYWIDELSEAGRRVSRPAVFRGSKAMERALYQSADAVVQLTQVAIDDLRAGRFGPWPAHRPAICIPTCADYEGMRAAADPERVPAEVRQQLRGRRVLAWIGSVNPSYATAESMTVTRRVLDLRDDAVLLVLTRSLDPLQPYLDAAGIDPARVLAASAPHEDMASWLSLVDWGLMLGRRSEGKRASMPTKLAEFLALGVRPVQHGFNDDVDLWVERAGSGVVLSSLQPDELERAAQRIASDDLDPRELDIARERTRAHFDLPSGVERYAWLLSELARAAA